MSIQWDLKSLTQTQVSTLILLFLEFLSGIKRSYKREREREREISGLNSTTSYLTVTGSSLTTQNFCITEALFDAANSVNPPA